jgi:drug/metabolite transporter (DMT)-like permease
MKSSSSRVGLGLVVASALLFSAKAVFVKLSYVHGVDAITLLALRMIYSLPVFAVIAWREERRAREEGTLKDEPFDRWRVAALGALGYYLGSYLDFVGLQYVTASLERLVLFTYPTFTVLFGWLFFRQRITRREVLALSLTYAGIALAFGGDAGGRGEHAPLGAALVAMSAFVYAAYLVGSGRIVGRIGATRLVAQAMTVSAIAVLVHFALTRPLSLLAQPTIVQVYAVTIAVFCTVAPTLLLGHGIRRVGASDAAIAGSIGPMSTIGLAAIFLGERMGALELAGSVLVVLGVLSLGRKAPQVTPQAIAPPGIEPAAESLPAPRSVELRLTFAVSRPLVRAHGVTSREGAIQ